MRLIDADALKKTFCAECNHSISCENCDIDFHFEHLAPTVDAIPITWLERWGATTYTSYESANEVLFEIQYKPIILRAIEDYKKERGDL